MLFMSLSKKNSNFAEGFLSFGKDKFSGHERISGSGLL
jgi:hypothetical protein